MERRGERICMAQHHHKVNADIAQIRPQSSDLYETSYWDSSRPEKEKRKIEPNTFVTKNQVQITYTLGADEARPEEAPQLSR